MYQCLPAHLIVSSPRPQLDQWQVILGEVQVGGAADGGLERDHNGADRGRLRLEVRQSQIQAHLSVVVGFIAQTRDTHRPTVPSRPC